MSLFQTGEFNLHSGQKSTFKIDCDALTDEDIKTVALMLVHRLPAFGFVIGVPQGGLRLAKAMKPFIVEDSNNRLIVDDVLTTGGSMEKFKKDMYLPIFHPVVFGAVIFARSFTPDWITPLFRLEK